MHHPREDRWTSESMTNCSLGVQPGVDDALVLRLAHDAGAAAAPRAERLRLRQAALHRSVADVLPRRAAGRRVHRDAPAGAPRPRRRHVLRMQK